MGAESKRRILEALPADWSFEGKRILDFGCGAGCASPTRTTVSTSGGRSK